MSKLLPPISRIPGENDHKTAVLEQLGSKNLTIISFARNNPHPEYCLCLERDGERFPFNVSVPPQFEEQFELQLSSVVGRRMKCDIDFKDSRYFAHDFR